MGPDQHAQLDGFGLTFPFPIRVAALMVAGTSRLEMGYTHPSISIADFLLGFWGWAIILQYLQKTEIVSLQAPLTYPKSPSATRKPL